MVLKRSWQVGVCLGAALLLAGMAQAGTGYWKQQGALEYPEKGAAFVDVHGGYWKAKREYKDGSTNVRFTMTGRGGELQVTEITWTPPPDVLIPEQVVPLSARMQVLKSQPEGKAAGGISCFPAPRPTLGSITDLFNVCDQDKIFQNASTGFCRDLTNTKNTVAGVNRERKLYLTHCAYGPQISIKVATPYVWVEGVPPAQPAAPKLPPMVVVTDGKIPPFAPTTPVTPTAPVTPTQPGPAVDIAGTWRHGADTGETWTFTPLGGGRYAAVATLGIASGTAVVTGNKMIMDVVSKDGKITGKYQGTFAADGRSANGTLRDSTGASGTYEWVRVGDPPATTVRTPTPPPWPGPTPGPTTVAGMTLRAETRKAKSGETVTVPVWLLKGAGLIDLNFNLEYDPSVVQAVGNVVRGNLLEGADFEANTAKPGVVQVGLVPKTCGIGSADGTIAQVVFKAIGRPGSRTTLRLVPRKASVTGGAAANPATIDGEIQIVDEGGFLPGDVNGDGKAGMDDVLIALKISVELLPHNARADVDRDGQVTAADARLIRDMVLGIKG